MQPVNCGDVETLTARRWMRGAFDTRGVAKGYCAVMARTVLRACGECGPGLIATGLSEWRARSCGVSTVLLEAWSCGVITPRPTSVMVRVAVDSIDAVGGGFVGQSLQKFRSFYSLEDAAVPAGLRSRRRKRRSGGRGEVGCRAARGLSELPDYFAGKRYLPDDEVLGLLADDAARDVGPDADRISHIELREMTLAQKAAVFEESALRCGTTGMG